MPSRPLPPSPSPSNVTFFTKARALFLVLTISASIVILLSLLYLLYHLWYSLLAQRSRTIPFDSTPPSKLHNFTYRELRLACNDFAETNILGKGGSGTVYRGISKDGKLIAIKRLDALSLQTEREFQNELHILGGLRSQFLVPLLGYCVEKNNRILVYEYVPNRSLQESLFGDGHGHSALSWERRFGIILDVAKALEFLHIGCDPPVIHGDIKPSNVLLDSDFHGRVSDFGLSRIKVDSEFFSQELSGTLAPSPGMEMEMEMESTNEVDFALALQASSSPKAVGLSSIGNEIVESSDDMFKVREKGKEVEDWNRFVPNEDDHSKELNLSCSSVDKAMADSKQWGEDWWWRQDGSGELCSKDYVKEWIGSQIGPSENPVWEEGKDRFPEKISVENHKPEETQLEQHREKKKKNRKMQEWWKEEHLAEIAKKGSKLKKLKPKLKKRFKIDLGFRFRNKEKKPRNPDQDQEQDPNHDFSFRKGWRKRNNRSFGSAEMFSGDLLSSTTSMRGTLCYVAPEQGGSGYLIEKSDIYSFGVLILVIVSGRRPLHVLASPMKLEKANLISWCRQLAHSGNVLELVDEKLRGEFSKEQAGLCINLALACLQKMPELRPEIGEIVKVLRGEMDLPATAFEFSPSPPSRLYSRSRRKLKGNAE